MASTKKPVKKKAEYIHSYYTDLDVNDQLYASIIRSPVSSGTIRSIVHPDLPEDYRIITSKDIQGTNVITVLDTSFPIFAFEKVSYIGEPIGLMCGPDIRKIGRLMAELDIKYTEAQISDNEDDPAMTGEQIIKHSVIQKGDPNTTFVRAAVKLEKTYTSKHYIKTYKELLGCLAIPEKKSITLFLPASWACHIRKTVSGALAVEEDSVLIKSTITSDSANTNLWASSMLAAQSSVAAQTTGKPVKLVLGRNEMEKFIDNPVTFTTRFQAALEKSGRITGLTARVMVDTGAFAPFADDIINKIIVSAMGPYKVPNFQIEVFIRRTTKPPFSVDINISDAHSLFALELFIQEISRRIHIMPHELRLLNYEEVKQENDKDNDAGEDKNPVQYPDLNNGKILSTLENVLSRSDFLRRYVSFSLTSEAKNSFIHHAPIRGIGLAAGFQGSGFLSSKLLQNSVSLEVTMKMDESVIIHALTHSKSIQHIWKTQAASILSIPEESIHLDPESTLGCEEEIPETMSNKISTLTTLVKKCCNAIQKMRFRQPLPIKIKRTIQLQKNSSWNMETLTGKPYHSIAWAAAVIEVEVNTFTYELSVLSVWVTIDAGEILHPKDAELSIKKSIELILANSMTTQVLSAQSISVTFIESQEDSKEIGSCMNDVIPAALLNAVSVALHKPVTIFPLETDTIYSILTTKEEL